MTPLGILSCACAEAACCAVDKVGLGELSSMSEVEDFMGAAVGEFVKTRPELSGMADFTDDLMKKAADTIGPVIEQKLKDYGPTFAVTLGSALGIAYILGNILTRRELRRGRRAA